MRTTTGGAEGVCRGPAKRSIQGISLGEEEDEREEGCDVEEDERRGGGEMEEGGLGERWRGGY